MPPLVPQPNVFRVRQKFLVGADSGVKTAQHFAFTGPSPSNADCAAIAQSINGFAAAHLAPLLSTGNNLIGTEVADLSSLTAGFGEYDLATDGAISGAQVPAGTCALMSMKIARKYRGGKPRCYWPFGGAASLVNATGWTSAFVTLMEGNMAAYLAAVKSLYASGQTITNLVNVSYYSGFTVFPNPIVPGRRSRNIPTPRTVAIAPDIVTSFVFQQQCASQRRRNATP